MTITTSQLQDHVGLRAPLLFAAVILLGFGLNLRKIGEVGLTSLPIILSTIATSLIVAFLMSRALHMPGKIATLIGVGAGVDLRTVVDLGDHRRAVLRVPQRAQGRLQGFAMPKLGVKMASSAGAACASSSPFNSKKAFSAAVAVAVTVEVVQRRLTMPSTRARLAAAGAASAIWRELGPSMKR